MQRIHTLAALAAVAALALPALSHAATLSYGAYDTRAQGAFAPDAVSNDADGSLKLQTFDNTSLGKVSVVFGTGAALGNLGDLNTLAIDYMKSSTPALNGGNTNVSQFAYRLFTNSTGTQSLVWENQYNGNGVVPTDSFQSLDLTGGLFWQRTNGINYNGGAQAHPLSYYVAGGTEAPAGFALGAGTQIYGFEIAYGSGVGAFTGYIDHPTIGFGSNVYTANVTAVPEPTSLGLLALGGLALLRRKR